MNNNPTQLPTLAWVLIAAQFAPPFMFSGVAVALPSLGMALHADATSLGLMETLFLASQLAFLLPAGKLADASEKRSLFKLGLFGFCFTSLMISLLSSMEAILVLRFVQGITSALCAATGMAILTDIVPRELRGRALGCSTGAIYSGLTLGPIMAGYLIDVWDWRAVFWFGSALLFAGWAFVFFKMPSQWKRPAKGAVHLPSAVLLLCAVLSLVFGSALLHLGGWGYALLASGVLLATGFIRLQYQVEMPLVNMRLLMRNTIVRSALAVQAMLYVNAFSTVFMLSIYMQSTLDYAPETAGRIIAVGTLIMAMMAPVSGRLADRYNPRAISTIGTGFVLLATFIGVGLHDGSGLWHIAALLCIQSFGFALFSSTNMTTIMSNVPATKTSMASALAAKARSMGMMTGMLIASILISVYYGTETVHQHPERFMAVIDTAYILLSVITLGSFILCWRAQNRPNFGNEE